MRKTSDVLWQDAQHQVLFEILDVIANRARMACCSSLQDYTENHFSLEEQYMESWIIPVARRTCEAHEPFRRRSIKCLKQADRDALFREIIATFLTEWLTRHVFGIDKELEAFILQSDAAVSAASASRQNARYIRTISSRARRSRPGSSAWSQSCQRAYCPASPQPRPSGWWPRTGRSVPRCARWSMIADTPLLVPRST